MFYCRLGITAGDQVFDLISDKGFGASAARVSIMISGHMADAIWSIGWHTGWASGRTMFGDKGW